MEKPATSPLSLRCDRNDLLAGIQAADAVVPSNSAKPILTNLLFDGQKDHLDIIATDLQVGLRSLVRGVVVDSPGQAVVQARQLTAILKESRSQSVSLRLDQRVESSQLQITLADGDYQIPAVVGETFPPVQFFPTDVPYVTLRGARFEEMIRQTVFGMDKDRTSAVLSGIFVSIGHGEVVLAATDGKMLCEAVEKSDGFKLAPGGEAVQAVIPAVTINHLQRILAGMPSERVDVAFAGKLVFVRLSAQGGLQVELTSRLVEGNFPSYRNALPQSAPSAVVFDAGELASAVRRTALMTSSTSKGIVVSLDKDQAVFSNLNYTNGSARIPVPCAYQGSPLKLGVNAQYLSDVLKVFKGEKMAIELSRGLIMREANATYLIMPISLPS